MLLRESGDRVQHMKCFTLFLNFWIFLGSSMVLIFRVGSLGVGLTVNFELFRAFVSVTGAGTLPSHDQWLLS